MIKEEDVSYIELIPNHRDDISIDDVIAIESSQKMLDAGFQLGASPEELLLEEGGRGALIEGAEVAQAGQNLIFCPRVAATQRLLLVQETRHSVQVDADPLQLIGDLRQVDLVLMVVIGRVAAGQPTVNVRNLRAETQQRPDRVNTGQNLAAHIFQSGVLPCREAQAGIIRWLHIHFPFYFIILSLFINHLFIKQQQ